MTVTTLYPLYDGYLYSHHAVYATARSGGGLEAPSSSGVTLYTGQRLVGADFRCYEALLAFDTTGIPPGAVVSSAVLRKAVTTNGSTTDFTLEARQCTVGGAVTTAMWVPGADLASHTLLASLTTAGLPGVPTEMVLTSEAAMIAAINPYGLTGFVVTSDRLRAGTEPTRDEYLICPSVEDADLADRPTLTVTWTAGTPVFGAATPVLTSPAEAAFVASRVAAETDPEWSAWVELRDGTRLSDAVAFTAGAGNTDYTRVAFICEALDTASRHARNLATAYMCTGTASYAEKTRDIIVYWATYGEPPDYATITEYNYGFHMSWGGYAFALAYDLTKESPSYSAADHALLFDWFVAWADCEKSYALHWLSREAYAFSRTTETQAYEWTTNPLALTNNILDRYTAMDNPAGIMHAWYAAVCVTGYASAKTYYLYEPRFPLNVENMQHCATAPRNDGDGVAGHPNPVPCVQIYKNTYAVTPPGCTTYLSFDGRFHTLIYKMARNERRATAAMTAGISAYWNYMCRYAGTDAEVPPQGAGDVYDMDYLVSCLQLAANAVGHATGLVEVKRHGSSALYESQSSGYSLLTAPYTPTPAVAPPTFDTRNWTLRIGDADPIELMDRVSDLGYSRGDHGPGELHCILPTDWSPLLPQDSAIAKQTAVELCGGAGEPIWDGFLLPPAHSAADQSITLSAAGRLDEAKRNEVFDCIWTICNFDVWSTYETSPTQKPTQYQIDTDNRLMVQLPANAKTHVGNSGRVHFCLPTWATVLIQRITGDYAVTNPYSAGDPAPWEWRLVHKLTPKGAIMDADADHPCWHVHDHVNGTGNDSGSLDVGFTGADKPAFLELRGVDISGAGSDETLVDRMVILVNVCLYVRRAVKVSVDEALTDMLLDSGIVSAVTATAIGSPLDNVAILEPTTLGDALETISNLHTLPVTWRFDGDTAIVKPTDTTPPDRSKWFVAYIDPVGDACACPGYAVEIDSEDVADFVAVDFDCKDYPAAYPSNDYPDGTRCRVIYPASPAPGPTDRVRRLDYPTATNVTAAVALAFAQSSYELLRVGAAQGPIPLLGTAIQDVDGVWHPLSDVTEDCWLSVPDAYDSLEVQPFRTTGCAWEDGQAHIAHVGGSELPAHVYEGQPRSKKPRPRKTKRRITAKHYGRRHRR